MSYVEKCLRLCHGCSLQTMAPSTLMCLYQSPSADGRRTRKRILTSHLLLRTPPVISSATIVKHDAKLTSLLAIIFVVLSGSSGRCVAERAGERGTSRPHIFFVHHTFSGCPDASAPSLASHARITSALLRAPPRPLILRLLLTFYNGAYNK